METELRVTAGRVVAGLILATLLLAGPPAGPDLAASDDARLDDGTASVSVLEPAGAEIRVTDGRFGTDVAYVRLPDLVVDVEQFEGTPRVQYTVSVPGLDIERTETKLVTSEGRLRVRLEDRALPERPDEETYRGVLRVRVQSLSTEQTVLNRTVEVTVE